MKIKATEITQTEIEVSFNFPIYRKIGRDSIARATSENKIVKLDLDSLSITKMNGASSEFWLTDGFLYDYATEEEFESMLTTIKTHLEI